MMAQRRRKFYDGRDGFQYSPEEVQSLILPLYLKNQRMAEICEVAKKRLGIELSYADVNTEYRHARSHSRLSYQSGRDHRLAGRLEDFVTSREMKPITVDVIAAIEAAPIAHAGAERLCGLIAATFRDEPDRTEFHIGFAGGHSPCLMAKAMCEMLADPTRWDLPAGQRKVVFHSVLGHMNCSNPEVDPNAFFIYLAAASRVAKLPFELCFDSIPAPGVVTRAEHRRLTGADGEGGFGLMRPALLRSLDRLNIIVFSCGHWGPGHQSVHDYLDEACARDDDLRASWREMAKELTDAGVVGDVMWTPIHPERAKLMVPRPLRLLGLVEDIFDLCRFANPKPRSGNAMSAPKRYAMLLAAPCTGPTCQQTKGRILATLFRSTSRLPMSHLITDSRSARDCLAIIDPENAAAPPRRPAKPDRESVDAGTSKGLTSLKLPPESSGEDDDHPAP
jgi:hypothetical protein